MKKTKIPIERAQLIDLLEGRDLIGIELGVATGDFSKKMVDSKRFLRTYGVDLYGDHHDTSEYITALKYIGLNENYTLLRMQFDEALDLFDDCSLDFVYIDGYAHTGENEGKTILDWLGKVKLGGLIAGHDYDIAWPKVIQHVNCIAEQNAEELLITQHSSNPGPQDKYPSWAFFKTKEKVVAAKEETRVEILNVEDPPKQTKLPISSIRKFFSALRR